MTVFVKKLRCSVEYPVLGVILTGGAWDRDGGMGSSSSGSGWFQCLALYTALVGDCGKNRQTLLHWGNFHTTAYSRVDLMSWLSLGSLGLGGLYQGQQTQQFWD